MAKLDDGLCKELTATAHRMADAARQVILPYFRNSSVVDENKLLGGYDPVTIADCEAEAAMRLVLSELRPDDAILGEEHGLKDGTTGLTWVLDPIDGTRGFVAGTPTWGVLIALADANGPILGLIDQPYIGERFIGGFGQAEVNGPLGAAQLTVRKTRDLSQAVILTTFPEVGTKDDGACFHRLAQRCKLTRYGMDCYGYALLAAGQVDLVVEAGLQPYDIQAPIAVIEAAGGIVTDWQGGPAHNGGRALAAATPELHQAAMEILNG